MKKKEGCRQSSVSLDEQEMSTLDQDGGEYHCCNKYLGNYHLSVKDIMMSKVPIIQSYSLPNVCSTSSLIFLNNAFVICP